MSHFIACMILCASMAVTAQDKNEIFAVSELKVYVKIKSASVTHGINTDSIIHQWVLDSEFPLDRIGQIIKNGLDGQAEKLSEAEKTMEMKWRELHKSILSLRANHLLRLCKQYQMAPETYRAIDDKFRNDITFQQSLIPYFSLLSREK